VFWVISVYFNIRNTLPKSGTFLLGHPVYSFFIAPQPLVGQGLLVSRLLVHTQTHRTW